MLASKNNRNSLPAVLHPKMLFGIQTPNSSKAKNNNHNNNKYDKIVANINLNIDKSLLECEGLKNAFIKSIESVNEKVNMEKLILKNDLEQKEKTKNKHINLLDLELEEKRKKIKLVDLEMEEKKNNVLFNNKLQAIELENLSQSSNQLEINQNSTDSNIESIYHQTRQLRHVICGPGLESNLNFKVLYKSDIHQEGKIECKIDKPHVHYIVCVSNNKPSISFLLKKKIGIKFFKSNSINAVQMEKTINFYKMNIVD